MPKKKKKKKKRLSSVQRCRLQYASTTCFTQLSFLLQEFPKLCISRAQKCNAMHSKVLLVAAVMLLNQLILNPEPFKKYQEHSFRLFKHLVNKRSNACLMILSNGCLDLWKCLRFKLSTHSHVVLAEFSLQKESGSITSQVLHASCRGRPHPNLV